MTEVSPMRLEMCCARKSCGHSRCPNRIGGSYIEQLGTTVSSYKHRCLVQDGNRRPIPCPRPRPGDGRRKDRTRTDPKPKRSRNNSPSLYVPWTVARRPPMVMVFPDQGLIKSY
ncbi:UNVERIFIED_CONTAM: hypothetical protein Slati_0147900 [Sesamum latifolium]|uniref:Uncharacterized protein n=1 Tax=Sesamum latifolium TaxID=2727402 RepID=A0AAW2Y9Z3_9LAMI